jgi:hypothetical protein
VHPWAIKAEPHPRRSHLSRFEAAVGLGGVVTMSASSTAAIPS